MPLDEDVPAADLTTLDVNLTGIIFTTKLALHHFHRNHEGGDKHLLFVGSMASFCSSPGILVLYTASKHAILGWWRSQYLHPGNESWGV
jgi:short-subunit dehydrogenase